MKAVIIPWEWWWYAYYSSASDSIATIKTNSLETLLDNIPSSLSLQVLVPEQACYFWSLLITRKETNPCSVRIWKEMIEELRHSMELRYAASIHHYSVECLQVMVNGERKNHILWQSGDIQAVMTMFALSPSWMQEKEILDLSKRSYDIYPRSYFFLQQQGKDGQYVIIHKEIIQVIHFQHGVYEHMSELNTGRKDLLYLLHSKGVYLQDLEDWELRSMQSAIVKESIESFLWPVFQRITSLWSPLPHQYILCDFLQHQRFLKFFHDYLEKCQHVFVIPMSQDYKKIFHSPVLEKYLSPLLFW